MPKYTGSSEQSHLLRLEISGFLGVNVTSLTDHLVMMSEWRLNSSVIDEYIAESGQQLKIPHLQYIPHFDQWTTDDLFDELEPFAKPFFLIRAFKQKLFPEREHVTKRPPNAAFLIRAFWSLFFQPDQTIPHNPAVLFPQLPVTVQDAITRFWSGYLKDLHQKVNPGEKYNPSDPVRREKARKEKTPMTEHKIKKKDMKPQSPYPNIAKDNGQPREMAQKQYKWMPSFPIIHSEDAQPAREFSHFPSHSLSSQPSSDSRIYLSTSYPSSSSSISSPPFSQSAYLSTFGSLSPSTLHLSPQVYDTSQYTNLNLVTNNLFLGEADFHCSEGSGTSISPFGSSPHSATQDLSPDYCDSYTDPWALFTADSGLSRLAPPR